MKDEQLKRHKLQIKCTSTNSRSLRILMSEQWLTSVGEAESAQHTNWKIRIQKQFRSLSIIQWATQNTTRAQNTPNQARRARRKAAHSESAHCSTLMKTGKARRQIEDQREHEIILPASMNTEKFEREKRIQRTKLKWKDTKELRIVQTLGQLNKKERWHGEEGIIN